MKTILLTLSLLTGFFFNQSKAAGTNENPAEITFQHRFGSATDVQWSELNGLYKAQFALDGTIHNAYFDAEGSLVAITRKVSSSELPASLKAALGNAKANRWIS